jgi:hypothetical protein
MYEFAIIAGATLSLVLYVMHFVWMSRISAATVKVAALLENERGLRSDLQQDVRKLRKELEDRPVVASADDAPAPTAPAAGQVYDSSRIPKNRQWYALEGGAGKLLVSEGHITKLQLEQAYKLHADKGGHVVDHIFALGFIDEPTLRSVLHK